jgi:hypothetical protein
MEHGIQEEKKQREGYELACPTTYPLITDE